MKNSIGQTQDDRELYFLGWILIAVLLLFSLLFYYFPAVRRYLLTPCVVHSLTGFYCPGCGGSRSLQFLFRGRWIESFIYHPFVLYGGSLFALFMVSNMLFRLTGRRFPRFEYRNIYVYIGAVLIFGNWLLKNLLLIMGLFVMN